MDNTDTELALLATLMLLCAYAIDKNNFAFSVIAGALLMISLCRFLWVDYHATNKRNNKIKQED